MTPGFQGLTGRGSLYSRYGKFITTLTFTPATFNIPVIELIYLYGFPNFLGGYLGLLPGASILYIVSDGWDFIAKLPEFFRSKLANQIEA